MSYGSITEEIFFALALMRACGTFDIALATADVFSLVMAAMNALSAEGGITGVVPSFDSSFTSAGVVLVVRAMIQTLWSTKLDLDLINFSFGVC